MVGYVTDFLIKNGNKLGIDLDEPSEFEFLKSYFNAKYMFTNNEIKVFQSSSGDGYHIVIYGIKSRLSIRRTLCDCHDRMMYSEMRSKDSKNKEEFTIGDPLVDDVLFAFKTAKYKYKRNGKRIKITRRRNRVELDEKSVICKRFW